MKPLKPWRSFADQLQQLQNRGLQVDDLLEDSFPNTSNGLLSLEDFGAVAGWKEDRPWKNQAHK